jgi:hypothetical protein
MSAIFPTYPASVRIHLLPKGEKSITYSVSDVLTFSAWMPDGVFSINQETMPSNDNFYANYCRHCHRNCGDYYDDYRDEYGDIDYDHDDLANDCGVYQDGYSGQSCPEGFRLEKTVLSFPISDMVFEVRLTHLGESPRFTLVSDSARLQKLEISDDPSAPLKASILRMASNVFGDEGEPGGICWGYNDRPRNLRVIVSQYFNTRFNNDLLPLHEFEHNCEEARYDNTLSSRYLPKNTHLLCGSEADAIMLLDAESNVQAFYTMIMAGFTPLTGANHIMAIPLIESEIEVNGGTYIGYLTIPDCVGKQWFISNETQKTGILLGQI